MLRDIDSLTLGTRGLELIKSFEKLSLTAYKPTPNDVWTIGYGHTRGVKQGQVTTIGEATKFLSQDTVEAQDAIHKMLPPDLRLTQSMYDALTSLVFNVGPSCINLTSTIGRTLRALDYYGAWRGFALWTKQGKVDLRGLAIRRSAEMGLFLEDPFSSGLK